MWKIDNFNLPHLHFVLMFEVILLEFHQDIWYQFPVWHCCTFMCLAVLIEHRIVTDIDTEPLPVLSSTRVLRTRVENYSLAAALTIVIWWSWFSAYTGKNLGFRFYLLIWHLKNCQISSSTTNLCCFAGFCCIIFTAMWWSHLCTEYNSRSPLW